MEIRIATMDDAEQLLRMAKQFIGKSEVPGLTYRPGSLIALAQFLLSQPNSTLLVADVSGTLIGMVGGVVTPNVLDATCLEATEFFWWVEEGHRGSAGIRLLSSFQEWAKVQGAKRVRMAALAGPLCETAEKVYDRLGYQFIEKHFSLEI